MLDSHEAHDMKRAEPRRTHVDGDDMTYSPVADNRTGTQRLNELAVAVMVLTQEVNLLKRKIAEMQGD